jgi:hypothetical protein
MKWTDDGLNCALQFGGKVLYFAVAVSFDFWYQSFPLDKN